MAKEYWLEWVRYNDFMKGESLPGGTNSLKMARLTAADYVKVNHPIDIDGSDEIVAKFGKFAYVVKEVKMNGRRVNVKIRILKDGSLSKTKITKASIIPDSVIKGWD